MAGAGARKRLDENTARLRLLAGLIAAGVVTFLGVRLTMFRQITHLEHWLGFAVTVIVEGLTFAAISMAAQPVYDGSGRLLDGGADLNKGAVSSYHDVLYLSVLVQLVAAFTNYGWLIYLLVPAYGSYLLGTKVLMPAFRAATDDGGAPKVDDATMRRMQKTEQRSQRRQVKRF